MTNIHVALRPGEGIDHAIRRFHERMYRTGVRPDMLRRRAFRKARQRQGQKRDRARRHRGRQQQTERRYYRNWLLRESLRGGETLRRCPPAEAPIPRLRGA